MVDSQGGMSLMKDLPSYMQYQMARAIGGKPGEGGVATAPQQSSFVDAGVGLGLGMMMPGVMAQANAQQTRSQQCGSCGVTVPMAPFCGNCGERLAAPPQTPACVNCGGELAATSRFCSGCGHEVGAPKSTPDPPAED
jgi:membrane protease subunit (stomatin/prohibitin family)